MDTALSTAHKQKLIQTLKNVLGYEAAMKSHITTSFHGGEYLGTTRDACAALLEILSKDSVQASDLDQVHYLMCLACGTQHYHGSNLLTLLPLADIWLSTHDAARFPRRGLRDKFWAARDWGKMVALRAPDIPAAS